MFGMHVNRKAPLCSFLHSQCCCCCCCPSLPALPVAPCSIAMFRVHMYRKQLLCSYLRDAPYDDVLHEACPDYEPESIRQKREHEEAMRVRWLVRLSGSSSSMQMHLYQP